MKKRLLPALLLIAFNGILLSSCYNDNEEDLYPTGACNLTSVTYAAVIKPIITQNCALAGCHGNGTASSSVALEDYTGLKAIADDGRLVRVINHSSGVSAMPKNLPKLQQCYLDQIAKWVTDGAPNN